jgi:glycosyl transferase, family 25
MQTLMITLVISLPDAVERQRRISASLQSAGISFSIVHGVVGRDLTRSQIASVAPSRFMVRFSRELGPGEIGCTLSHKLALEKFLESNDDIALILEDDAVVPPNLAEAIAHLPGHLPKNWGLLKIGGMGGVRGRLVCATDFGKIIETPATTVCSHAYVVSRCGARRLLDHILPIRFPYDIYLRTHTSTAPQRLRLFRQS